MCESGEYLDTQVYEQHLAYMQCHCLEFNLVFQHSPFYHFTSVSMIRRLSDGDRTRDH